LETYQFFSFFSSLSSGSSLTTFSGDGGQATSAGIPFARLVCGGGRSDADDDAAVGQEDAV
jgi:hypothetical protein